jgi:hypothetical protein
VIGIGGVLQLELATAGSTRPIDRHASEDRHDNYDLRVPDFRPVDRYNESAGTNFLSTLRCAVYRIWPPRDSQYVGVP